MKRIVSKFIVQFTLLPIRAVFLIIRALRLLPNILLTSEFISELRSRISNEFNKIVDATYLSQTINTNVKLTYLDIGARDGLPDWIMKNKKVFEKIILCEGEANEVAKLKKQGFLVIDKFLSDKIGLSTFYYISKHPGASSLYQPATTFLHLFSNTHFSLYNDYKEETVNTSTLDHELSLMNVSNIDLIKIDVQGAELSVINGFKSISPLFWEVEVLSLPSYINAPYGVSIGDELINRGYICFRQCDRMVKDGMPIFANELYMPDYNKVKGKELIKNNFEKWKALMDFYDLTALRKHIEEVIL